MNHTHPRNTTTAKGPPHLVSSKPGSQDQQTSEPFVHANPFEALADDEEEECDLAFDIFTAAACEPPPKCESSFERPSRSKDRERIVLGFSSASCQVSDDRKCTCTVPKQPAVEERALPKELLLMAGPT